MGNISNLEMRCCAQEDKHARWSSELLFEQRAFEEHDLPEDAPATKFHCSPGSCSPSMGVDFHACQPPYKDDTDCPMEGFGMQEFADAPLDTQRSLEALSYTPGGFDQGATFDTERSHARYSKIVGHSTRARTQKRSRAWDEWLRGAVAGRSITLLGEKGEGRNDQEVSVDAEPTYIRIPAMYHLNRDLSKLSILPNRPLKEGETQEPAIVVPIDDIQVICPAADYKLFFDQLDAELGVAEKPRTVLVQYNAGDAGHRRVCFIEESELAKDSFVQALTALWLEKRSSHSMWF